MKLAVPMMAAWYLHDRQIPPRAAHLLVLTVIIIIPTLLIARQPDLGTSLLIAASGVIVVVLAGLSIRLMLGLAVMGIQQLVTSHVTGPAKIDSADPAPATLAENVHVRDLDVRASQESM